MRAILVDDEPLALKGLAIMLSELEGIEVIGQYRLAMPAIDAVEKSRPDVVFLDIEMPGMTGMEAAQRIRLTSPDTAIVFVTAYRKYALAAFEVEAVDYLVKPIARDRLQRSIERIHKRNGFPEASSPDRQAPAIHLTCMNKLELFNDRMEIIDIKWRTTKIKELFAYLFHSRGQVVSKDTLIQLLWPNIEEKRGIGNLQMSIYRIRQSLQSHRLEEALSIAYSGFGYIFKVKALTVDSEQWDIGLRELLPLADDSLDRHMRLFEAYKGDYFGEEGYIWAEAERQRLKSMWLQLAHGLAQHLVSSGQAREALTIYYRVIRHDPLMEEAYLAIMRIYDLLGDRQSVETHYRMLVDTLEREAGLLPGYEAAIWYTQWSQSV